MSGSSQNRPPERASLALEPDLEQRLGATRYRLLKLWVRDVNGAFEAAYGPFVRDDSVLLDAGCSRGDPDLPSVTRAALPVGCDMDLAGLRANTQTRSRVQAPLDALPFRNASFDVVVCKFVVEHLAAPRRAFAEFWRVLRPGGVLAVLTPNRNSLFAFLSRLVPLRLKQTLKKRLFGGHEEDTFPTRYRANTPRRLDALMAEAGFRRERLDLLAGMWAFFIFCAPLAHLVRALERVQMRVPGLRGWSTQMLGIYCKPLTKEPA